MTKEKWNEIKIHIKNSFGIEEEYEDDLDPGIAEILEFNGPKGRMMLCHITKPKILDKKTSYSNRAGSAVKVDYVFSDKEFSSYLELYTWSEENDDWEKMEVESIF